MSFRIYSTLAKGHKAKASILRVCEASLHSRAFAAESGKIPRRDEMVNRLKKNEEYDILVIGGGSTGAGAALDAASRGLKVACVECEDFGSGTSSRSTKLIWGGSRYLVEALVALFNHDLRLLRAPFETIRKFKQDFKMVMNCHRERKFMLLSQPHLVKWIPIAVPLTKWILWPPPFDYPPAAMGPLGLFPLFFKFYDALSGFTCPPSHIMTPSRTRRKFPQMIMEGLKYCSVFYEGQFDDARTNLAIAQSASKEGADMGNYCNVLGLTHDQDGKVNGATVRDEISGETFTVRAKGVLLCGGPFTDTLRKMENKDCPEAVMGARGIHIVLPGYFAPAGFGLVDMSTSDGRFMFFLPWEGHVLVGTTDHKTVPTLRPSPPEAEILWLLNECSKYLNPELKVRRQDVMSSWAGIRPLVKDPNADPEHTASASRDHVVSHDKKSDMVFVSGGKWTTYREMAEDAVDKIISVKGLLPKSPSRTLNIGLVGKEGYTANLPIRLVQDFNIPYSVASHLVRAYGGRAHEVCDIVREEEAAAAEARAKEDGEVDPNECGGITLLVSGYPYITAEITYAVRNDWACRIDDILARRTRLLFLNKEAAIVAVPRVADIMARELQWSLARKQEETLLAYKYIEHFGGPVPDHLPHAARFSMEADIKHAFDKADANHGGFIAYDDLTRIGVMLGHHLTEEELSSCVRVCDKEKTGRIEREKFVEWWNSEHENPLREKVKSRMASSKDMEGSGTVFG